MDIKKKKRKKNQIMNLKTGIIFMIDVFFSHLFQMATTTSPFFSLLLLLFFYSLSPLLFFFFFFFVMNHSAQINKLPTYDV